MPTAAVKFGPRGSGGGCERGLRGGGGGNRSVDVAGRYSFEGSTRGVDAGSPHGGFGALFRSSEAPR
jgi:hypothetical protein